MEPALRFCRDDVQGWYAAFYDEIRNMNQKAMPHEDLDAHYVDSLNRSRYVALLAWA
jgi:hypothetical protein